MHDNARVMRPCKRSHAYCTRTLGQTWTFTYTHTHIYLRAAAPAADPGKNTRRFVMQKSGPLSFSVPFSDTLLLLRTLQIVLVLLIHNGS